MKLTMIRTNKAKQLCVTTITIDRFLKRIAKDDSKAKVTMFRREAPFLNGQYDEYADHLNLHRVYPAAEFTKDANGNLQFKTCNGLLLIKISELRSEAEISMAKQTVAQLPMTFAAITGADNSSLIVLVRIAKSDGSQPDTEADAEQLYRMALDIVLPVFTTITGGKVQNIEPSLKDNFIMTLDAAPYYNKNATPVMVSGVRLVHDGTRDVADNGMYDDYEYVYRKTDAEVRDEMNRSSIEWTDSTERIKAIIASLSARLCQLGFPEEETFTHIRRHNWSKLPIDSLRQIVSVAYAENAPADNMPQKHDNRNKSGKGREEIMQMINFLQSRYVFRYNKVKKCTEFRTNDTYAGTFQPLCPRVQKRMTIEVQMADIRVSIKDVRNFLESDLIKSYDPVDDYLYGYCSGQWDGKDHIRALARTVPTKTPHWEDWFYTWFLAMVNQWRGYGNRLYGNSVAPLLISAQGYNKSTFCRSLIPPELQWGYNDNLLLSEKRQVLQAMSQFLLINLDEFNQISPTVQQGFLKNIIQLPSVKVKRPYGTSVEEFPRLASFIATSNLTDILADPSGNRRFIGVELTAPIDVSVKPNHRQLFAQALHALEHHEKAYFDDVQTKLLMQHNTQFAIVTPIEQYFDEYFAPADNENEGKFMTTAAIFDYLKQKIGSSIKAHSIIGFGRMLANRPDIIRRRTKKGFVYLVVTLK